LGSDSRSSKAHHRFGFSGPLARQKKDRVTADDVLDSLTRQAELRQKLGEKDQIRLEEIAEMEDLSQLQRFNPERKEKKLWTSCIRLYASRRIDSSMAIQFDLQAV
jgi:hypothetical protein